MPRWPVMTHEVLLDSGVTLTRIDPEASGSIRVDTGTRRAGRGGSCWANINAVNLGMKEGVEVKYAELHNLFNVGRGRVGIERCRLERKGQQRNVRVQRVKLSQSYQ
ncbi:hypothetical protein R1sor_003863 [Riccia sorocarpa]|uniref:Uncharacterized protein n=1 Tax=Riccia sorocarpa TaxID=122646 RepID=A0ABD3H6X4_9MARC